MRRWLFIAALLIASPAQAAREGIDPMSASALLPIRLVLLNCKTVDAAKNQCDATEQCCDVYERKKKEQEDETRVAQGR